MSKPKKDNRHVTKHTKTLEDACNALGDKHPFVWDWKHLVIISPDKLTYDKIRTITASLHKT